MLPKLHQPPHVLVVDDDPTVCMTAKFLLKNYCFVHTAENGKQALAILNQESQIVLVLSDVFMPEMGGLDLLRELRATPAYAELPVILISSENTTRQKVEGLELGADDFVTKPFSTEELLARVYNQLRIGGLRGQLRSANTELHSTNDALQEKNALMQKDLAAARKMQYALLPITLPNTNQIAFAAKYRPIEMLGGDFYDVVTLNDGKSIGILIADVTGHGVSAAFLTSITKVAFQNVCYHTNDPAQVLAQMNTALSYYAQSAFVTCFYAVYSLENATLQYASGGHPPLLICSKTGAITELKAQDTFLGLFPDTQFSSDSIQINHGDRVLFYTDALYETFNTKGQDFGYERVYPIIAKHLNRSLEETLDALEAELLQFADELLDDDLTMVVFERL